MIRPNLIKNKKASTGEAIGITGGEIITWIILFALIAFALFYFSGFGSKLLAMLKGAFT